MDSLTPTEFVAVVNQTLEYAYAPTVIVGEVASFKVNQGKWVFFDIKDENASVGCFMSVWGLRMPIEDGMKVMVKGVPKVTNWGKFSFTVQAIQPVGEGSLKKAYELLKKKLAEEGLFDAEKKRALPKDITKIGVISSTQAAGYADFIKIINARWGGLKVQVAHCQVQGLDAPDQMRRALQYFNEKGEVQVIAMIRGGGSADDLACFNDEELVRAVASSKIPVATGIGHEIDESLCDLASDFRASTPSNLAELLTPDKKEVIRSLRTEMSRLATTMRDKVSEQEKKVREALERVLGCVMELIDKNMNEVRQKQKILEALNPEKVLRRGYAIIAGKMSPGGFKPGELVKITTYKQEIKAEIKEANEREKTTE